jgi:hypothetical protein
MNSCSDVIVNVAARLNTPSGRSQALALGKRPFRTVRRRFADPAISAGSRHKGPPVRALTRPGVPKTYAGALAVSVNKLEVGDSN